MPEETTTDEIVAALETDSQFKSSLFVAMKQEVEWAVEQSHSDGDLDTHLTEETINDVTGVLIARVVGSES